MAEASVREWVQALTRPATAVVAAEALRGTSDLAAIEGLCELLCSPPSARAAQAALAALEGADHPLVIDALRQALSSPYALVRLGASEALGARVGASTDLVRVLAEDSSWLVRR